MQVYRIDGDLVELLFYPREVDLRVGETLTLRERDTGRSVIAQVIAFRSASYPSLVQEQMLNLLGPEPLEAPLLEAIGYRLFVPNRGKWALGGAGQYQSGPGEDPQDRPGETGSVGNNGMAGSRPGMRIFSAHATRKSSPTPPATWGIR